ncbi:NACHT domain-containing protein [Pseudoalteromonas sp. SG43-5]|uniref:NACHT domain-containing protein n=1 Tax=Pseudoalteromonas sp. SG43-5 TaxID=2760968 RepID=UPI0015FF4E19|nr:NACHT domain-containing protein [Pseudoalteromonas sp. SG43-5]MBB1456291.1 NACHT domain-containing protein [Pseudoalteromonas sp. SG43-5]
MNDGKKFEREVADAFLALGYKVELDVQIAGKQIDLIARTRTPGISNETKLYVECKNYVKSNLNSEDIDKFSNSYSRVKTSVPSFTGGVLVTRKALSPKVANSIVNAELSTTTLYDLKNESVGVLRELREYLSSYKSDKENEVYIPLKYSKANQRQDLLKYTNDWLESGETLLVLLGDFGTGKSTFLKRLKYELARNYLDEQANLIPLYITLKNFDTYTTVESFFEAQLSTEFSRSIRFEEFAKLSKEKNFVVLLDGFDEMGLHIDSEKRKKHFEQLVNIISRSKKSILTCRPSYFLSKFEMTSVLDLVKYPINLDSKKYKKNIREEYNDFAKSVFSAISNEKEYTARDYYSVLNLSGFSAEDIDEYLNKFYSNESCDFVIEIRNRIRNTYDLEDLAKRPILLFLIATSLPNLSNDKEATPSLIYFVYTSAWMKRDEDKGEFRKLITQENKRDFVCNLAWNMYENNVLELSYLELPQVVQDYFSDEESAFEYFVTHIQSCAFLNRDESNVFRFAHKSFMEFFAALHLANFISKERDFSLLENLKLSKEVGFFLGDMCYTQPELLNLVEEKFTSAIKSSSAASETLKSNMLSIYSKSRKPFPKHKIYDLKFSDLDFLKNTFSNSMYGCTFTKSIFKECAFKQLEFIKLSSISSTIKKNSSLKNVSIAFSEEDNVLDIEDSKLHSVDVQGSATLTIKNCKIYESKFSQIKQLNIIGTDISKSQFDTSKIEGEHKVSSLKSCVLFNSSYKVVGKRKTLSSAFRLQKMTYTNCTFVLLDFSVINMDNCLFKNCIFIGCCFSYLKGDVFTSGMTFDKCKFMFSNISFNSWFEAESNYLEVRKSEYYEELSDLRKLISMNKANKEKYSSIYKEKEEKPPKLPPEPKILSDRFITNLEVCIEAKRTDLIVDEKSLPYSECITKDVNWIECGNNLFNVFLKYLK